MDSFPTEIQSLSSPDKTGKKKKTKRKKSELGEFMNNTDNNSNFSKVEPSSNKKRKKSICNNVEQYKPGMLSNLLQEKKYGSLILPWEASFGKDQHQGGLFRESDGAEQKPQIKINPLFDTARRTEENTVTKDCRTYTVFIGNLPQEVSVNRVKKLFKKLGNTISKIKIRSDDRKNNKLATSTNQNSASSTNQNKRAVVKFSSSESYEAALKMNGKLFHGHHLRITGTEGATPFKPEKSVFIGNLAAGTSDDILWKTFENCGEIESVRVIKDKLNKKGIFGYVNFQDSESVEEALKLDGTSVIDREIRVRRINHNIGSLSNLVTVKRNKKKPIKSQLTTISNEIENSKTDNTFNGKRKKKSSKLKPEGGSKEEMGPEASLKKKKKKKKKDSDENGEN